MTQNQPPVKQLCCLKPTAYSLPFFVVLTASAYCLLRTAYCLLLVPPVCAYCLLLNPGAYRLLPTAYS